jgi:hypothetical protein
MPLHFWIRKLFAQTPVRKPTTRLSLERYEDRITPATFSEAGAILNLDFNTTNEAVSYVSKGTSYTLTLTGTTWEGTDTANAIGNGTTTLTVTTAGLTAIDTVNLTDSAAGTAVTFADSGANSYSDTFNVTLDDAAAGAINFKSATSFTGGASLSASASRNIAVNPGASLSVANGNLSLSANQQATATAGPPRRPSSPPGHERVRSS